MSLEQINNNDDFIKSYDVNRYDRLSLTNDVLIFTTDDREKKGCKKVSPKGMQVLLIRRNEHPYKDMISIPGGFIKVNESLDEGVRRILKEKVGIDDLYTEQLYTFGDVKRDIRTRVISIANFALIEKSNINLALTCNSQWFWIDKMLISHKRYVNLIEEKYMLTIASEDDLIKISYEVTEITEKNCERKKQKQYKLLDCTEELAFDHYKIIDYSIDRLRNKIEYTSLVFNLLSKSFTVKELQNVYEAVMGRSILNFRRKMGNMIIETKEIVEGMPYRPAKIYKFNEEWDQKN